jgi:hypothetical protein
LLETSLALVIISMALENSSFLLLLVISGGVGLVEEAREGRIVGKGSRIGPLGIGAGVADLVLTGRRLVKYTMAIGSPAGMV